MRVREKLWGFTLVELMLSLGLGSFILLGSTQLLLASVQAALLARSQLQLQTGASLALEAITRDLRRGGYQGCDSTGGAVVEVGSVYEFTPVSGYDREETWSPHSPQIAGLSTVAAVARRGSDVLHIQFAEPMIGLTLSGAVADGSRELSLRDNPGCTVKPGSRLILSSCKTAHLFEVGDMSSCSRRRASNPGTLEVGPLTSMTNTISPGYPVRHQPQIYVHHSIAWYVANTGRKSHGEPIFALYRKDNALPAREVVAGVEHLQLLYGVSRPSGQEYLAAGEQPWQSESVSSVRTGLLLKGEFSVRDPAADESLQLLDREYKVGDIDWPLSASGGLRLALENTVNLRNSSAFREVSW